MTATGPKISKAVMLDLAWIHLTGWHRPRVNVDTRIAARECCDRSTKPLRYAVKPELAESVAALPLVKAVQDLQAQGYKIDNLSGRLRKQSRYIWMSNYDHPVKREQEKIVYVDGGVY